MSDTTTKNSDKSYWVFMLNAIFEKRKEAKYKFLILFFLLYIFFESTINGFLKTIIVAPVISQFESTKIKASLFILLCIGFFIYLTILAKRKYQFSEQLIIVSLSLWFPIAYYRFIDSSTWSFHKISANYIFTYIDFSLLTIIFVLILKIRNNWLKFKLINKVKESQSEDENLLSLLIDAPWKIGEPDKINFEPFAKARSKDILSIKTERSFAIGIVGKWGTGKTSFLEMLIFELEKDETVELIQFNPWMSNNPDKIFHDFFEAFKAPLTKYSGKLSPAIDNYVNKLQHYDKSKITQLYKDFIQDDVSLKEQFSSVNNIIKSFNKKIIIVIDDIDRLDKKEVISVLKLIRKTADFHNTTFLAAYDHSYVVEAIKDINSVSSKFYLEKIFQTEITLPTRHPKVIYDDLKQLLTKSFPKWENQIDTISLTSAKYNNAPNEREMYDPGWLVNFISTIRDVKRLYNSILTNYYGKEIEFEFEDCFFLEVIKLKCHPVYEMVKERTLLTLSTISENPNFYFLDMVKFKSSISGSTYELKENEILKLLVALFPNSSKEVDKPRCIQKPSNFDLYFSGNLFELISLTEFRKARNNGVEDLKLFIDKCIDEELVGELKEILNRIQDFDSRLDFELIIEASIYLVSKNVNYDLEVLFKKLTDTHLSKMGYFYPRHFKAKLEDLLYNYKSTSIAMFLGFILDRFRSENPESFILNEQEIQNLTLKIFKDHTRHNANTTKDTIIYHESCQREINKTTHEVLLLKEANDLFIDLIKKDPLSYLANIVYEDNLKLGCRIKPSPKFIFGELSDFQIFLRSLPSKSIIKNTLSFIESYIKNNEAPTEMDGSLKAILFSESNR